MDIFTPRKDIAPKTSCKECIEFSGFSASFVQVERGLGVGTKILKHLTLLETFLELGQGMISSPSPKRKV